MEPFTLLLTAVVILVFQRLLKAFPPSTWSFCLPIYLKLTRNTTFAQLISKKRERSQLITEKNKLSPQDQYAKWTKLNRKHDALTKEITQLEEKLLSVKSTLDSSLSSLPKLITFASFALRFWYRKQPVFYLPQDTLPYLAERLLAFPSVPIGAVGFGQWLFMLGTLLTGLSFIFANLFKKIDVTTAKQQAKQETTPVQ
ncbi:Golgi to ER traffic protein 1 [Cyberlindnera fabianii]|uniref:Golgi to ER traffic protein 1 n=1 Tax=Cyberlindnera fabianii TaxID=36022 RepID=A0A1V2LDP4_CYBFA|nr:Golgi to ER traffic protein 1 [Cyberlindnera fabianii]